MQTFRAPAKHVQPAGISGHVVCFIIHPVISSFAFCQRQRHVDQKVTQHPQCIFWFGESHSLIRTLTNPPELNIMVNTANVYYTHTVWENRYTTTVDWCDIWRADLPYTYLKPMDWVLEQFPLLTLSTLLYRFKWTFLNAQKPFMAQDWLYLIIGYNL